MLTSLRRSGLVRVIAKRLVQAVPVVWGVSFITFALMNLLPGGVALALLGEGATPSAVAALNIKLHLNEPFFTRYGHWIGGLLTGHLGTSIATGQSIGGILEQRLPVTLELGILALLLSVAVSIPVAVFGAKKPGGLFDRINIIVSMVGLSIPNFVIALLLILAFAVHLHWLPSAGWAPISQGLWPNLRCMVLPAATIAFALCCNQTRILRADLVDQMMSADYVMFALAKGISRHRILFRHALRNSLFGFLTVVGLNLGTLIGGTVIVEQIFSLPGIGQELIQSIIARDTVVVETAVVLLSTTVVVANLLTDIVYALLDPRIRYERAS